MYEDTYKAPNTLAGFKPTTCNLFYICKSTHLLYHFCRFCDNLQFLDFKKVFLTIFAFFRHFVSVYFTHFWIVGLSDILWGNFRRKNLVNEWLTKKVWPLDSAARFGELKKNTKLIKIWTLLTHFRKIFNNFEKLIILSIVHQVVLNCEIFLEHFGLFLRNIAGHTAAGP
jgi:hypothetical protein